MEPTGSELPSRAQVLEQMKKICDWQLANLPRSWPGPGAEPVPIRANGWIRSTFYAGVLAAARAWAERNRWAPGSRRHADDHCAGQIYLALYFEDPEPAVLAPLRTAIDRLIQEPRPGREEWWWCDALFMAPPVLSGLHAATGDARYLGALDRLWWDVVDFLYDPRQRLFFRDGKYRIHGDGSGPREPNGQAIFWGRGNGWVLAGLARLLQYVPAEHPGRARYVALFMDFAAGVVGLQSPADGLWRASLLDLQSYPAPEASASGLFCYALAWGVNQGLLPRQPYGRAALAAWRGLVNLVSGDGRVGWVQLPGERPAPVRAEDSMEYGAGALLLAGREIASLLPSNQPPG